MSPDEDGPGGYEPCVAAFLDILGFRSLLSSSNAREILEVLGRVRNAAKPMAEPPPRSMDEVRLNGQTFVENISDAVVRLRPYETQHRDGALLSEIGELIHVQIELIRNGVLLRGGLSVGLAHPGFDGDGPFFGPAMARAYEIETNEAVHPRIVLGPEVIETFYNDERIRSQHSTFEYELQSLKELTETGDDGVTYIHYLAAEGEFDDVESYALFLLEHARFIRARQSEVVGRSQVERKIEWLRRYHNRTIERIERNAIENDLIGAVIGSSDVIYENFIRDARVAPAPGERLGED